MKIDGDRVTFETTGRVDRANGGIVGVSPGGSLFGGYDDQFSDEEKLTIEERNELADFMVAQWELFRTSGNAVKE